MKTLKQDWLIWLTLLVPFIFIAAYWNSFPDQIPTHFGMDGKPDDYSGKAFGLFSLPVLNILMYFLFIALPLIDPKRKNYALFSDKYRIIRIVFHLFMTVIFFATTAYALGYQFNISKVIMYAVLFLFLLLGNYMGNVKHNYFIGVRTPWTLANEEVWTKTHRLTAKIWVGATLTMMLILPFVPGEDTFFGIYLAIITVIPVAYSYVIFKQLNKY
jgi:uncharacterized membrane protein